MSSAEGEKENYNHQMVTPDTSVCTRGDYKATPKSFGGKREDDKKEWIFKDITASINSIANR